MSAVSAAERRVKYFLLTGVPGVGKTTLIKKICEVLTKNGISKIGYFTEEVRNLSKRVGFDVVTLKGDRGPLARIGNGPRKFKVGAYDVDLNSFETLVLPLFNSLQKDGCSVFIIDEIGKMELLSITFQKRVDEVFKVDQLILGTVPSASSDPLVRKIKANPYAKIIEVTRSNRNELEQTIAHDIMMALNSSGERI